MVLLLLLLLSGCSGVSRIASVLTEPGDPTRPDRLLSITDAVPRYEPPCRYGNMPTYTVLGKSYQTLQSGKGFSETGVASWYGPNFHGKATSCMEEYDMYQMTAAHKRLPLPSYVEVTRLDTGRKVVVRVNDRGPFHEDRIIDLSYAAAWKLGMIEKGTARVSIRTITPEDTPESVDHSELLQFGLFAQQKNAQALQQQLTQRIQQLHPTIFAAVEIRTINHPQQGRRYQVMLQPRERRIEALRAQLLESGIPTLIRKR